MCPTGPARSQPQTTFQAIEPRLHCARRLRCFRTPTAFLILALCGCQSLSVSKALPWLSSDEEYESPARLVNVWTPTIKYQQNRRPKRGFGARIIFYNQENQPVRVDGAVVVYAFNETDRDPANAVPDRKYVFPAEHLQKHYSECKLGHSYSFWVPWDDVGGRQTEISLIARFEPKLGPVVLAAQSKHLLQGTLPIASTQPRASDTAAPNQAGQPAHQVAFQQNAANGNTTGARSTTISIPYHLSRQAPGSPAPPPSPQTGTPSNRQPLNGFEVPRPYPTAHPPVNAAPPAVRPPPVVQAPPAAPGLESHSARVGPQVQMRPASPPRHAAPHWPQLRGGRPFGRQPESPLSPARTRGGFSEDSTSHWR